jgi:hypothetical protein
MRVVPGSVQNPVDEYLITNNPVKGDIGRNNDHSEIELVEGTLM